MRRHSGVVLCLALVLTAGCLAGGSPDPSSPTPEPSTAVPSPGGSTLSGLEGPTGPDPNKAIVVGNDWNRSVELRITVIRATNETVYAETYTLAPGVERTAYNLAEADPDGIETFTVVATAMDSTERVTIRTDDCHGDAHAEISSDGQLRLYYAIC